MTDNLSNNDWWLKEAYDNLLQEHGPLKLHPEESADPGVVKLMNTRGDDVLFDCISIHGQCAMESTERFITYMATNIKEVSIKKTGDCTISFKEGMENLMQRNPELFKQFAHKMTKFDDNGVYLLTRVTAELGAEIKVVPDPKYVSKE